jgi:hypothetical protein
VSAWTYTNGPPVGPQPAESDPEYAIEARQDPSLPFSMKGRELESQGRVLDGYGLVTADEQPNESEDTQQSGGDASDCSAPSSHLGNSLQADGIMANDNRSISRGKLNVGSQFDFGGNREEDCQISAGSGRQSKSVRQPPARACTRWERS